MPYNSVASVRVPLSRHPAYVPLVSVWLAALLGGCVMVLPAGLPAAFAGTSLLAPLAASQLALAALATAVGAIFGWLFARAISLLQAHKLAPVAAHQVLAKVDEIPDEAIATIAVEPAVTEEDPRSDEIAAEPHELETSAVTQPDATNEPAVNADGECDTPLIMVSSTVFDDAVYGAEDGDAVLGALLGSLQQSKEPRAQAPAVLDAIEGCEADSASEPPAAPEPEAAPAPAPLVEAPARHGKAVQLLRGNQTADLAMPQLIERFAVALDDRFHAASLGANTYLPHDRPAGMAEELRRLAKRL